MGLPIRYREKHMPHKDTIVQTMIFRIFEGMDEATIRMDYSLI
jgi:hypothetical protein